MTWVHFEQAATRYEAWYQTQAGRRVSQAERLLLRRLLRQFPNSATALEIGCGTAHFTRWLAGGRLEAFGLDRSPAMLAEARRLAPGLCTMLRSAAKHRLRGVRWASAVLPAPFHRASLPIPFGDVLAISAVLGDARG